MSHFSSKKWVTTNDHLVKLLKRCDKCWKLTLYGKLIIHYDEIDLLKIPQKKYTFILNTKSKYSTDDKLAHWVCFHLNCTTKKALIYDSLNSIELAHPHVATYLLTFCKSINFELHSLKLKTQQPHNFTCGYHVLWMLHKTHKLNFSALLSIKTVFLPYSIKQRETFVMKSVLNDFAITI